MPTKTYDVYQFDQLSSEVRTKVLDRERHVNVEDELWSAPTIEIWKGSLEDQGYESPKILFSGFGSQGDGACFEASVNLVIWLAHRGDHGKYRRLIRAAGEVEITIRHEGRYYHEHSMAVVSSYDGSDEAVRRDLDEVERLVEAAATDTARQIYRDLEQEYFARIDDGAVAETLRANNVLFHGDGCSAHE
jgi:hypothetical protein